MSYQPPAQFADVTVTCKANIYFEGKVVSHSLVLADGSKKSMGVIYPGSFKFNTGVAERMEIIGGDCRVRIADSHDWIGFSPGTWFDVPANSHFEIEVATGLTEYVCSFA